MRPATLSALLLIGTLRVVHEPPVLVRFEPNVPETEARQLAGTFKQALDEAGATYGSRPFELVEIRLHGTTTAFRNDARAPWWHAARMTDGRLHIQPVSTLLERGIFLRVVRHEAAHVALGARPGGTLPRWLEEGEAMRFAGEPGARSSRELLPSIEDVEKALSQPRSREEARRGYLSAAAFVVWLGPWDTIDLKSDFITIYRRFRDEASRRQ